MIYKYQNDKILQRTWRKQAKLRTIYPISFYDIYILFQKKINKWNKFDRYSSIFKNKIFLFDKIFWE